jgi:hypothetical protein
VLFNEKTERRIHLVQPLNAVFTYNMIKFAKSFFSAKFHAKDFAMVAKYRSKNEAKDLKL